MVLERFRAVRLLEKSENKPLFNTGKQNNAKTLTDKQLLDCCIQNRTSNLYWTEFYRRFNKLIDKKIQKTLFEINVNCNTDIADTLSFAIVEKIHSHKFLEAAVRHPNFHALLNEAIRNIVIDWHKKQKTQKNAYGYAVHKGMKSLDQPRGDDEGAIRLGEVIATPETDTPFDDDAQDTRARFLQLFKAADNLPEIERFVFKASMIFYNSLSDKDILEIAAKRSVTPEKVEEEIDEILDYLVEKNDNYGHQQNLVAIKSAFLTRQQNYLHELEKTPDTPKSKLEKVIKKITEKKKQLENQKLRAQKIDVYPTASQVAQLLGIPKGKQKNVGVWLFRAKQKLRKMPETVIKNKKSRYDILSVNEKRQ